MRIPTLPHFKFKFSEFWTQICADSFTVRSSELSTRRRRTDVAMCTNLTNLCTQVSQFLNGMEAIYMSISIKNSGSQMLGVPFGDKLTKKCASDFSACIGDTWSSVQHITSFYLEFMPWKWELTLLTWFISPLLFFFIIWFVRISIQLIVSFWCINVLVAFL